MTNAPGSSIQFAWTESMDLARCNYTLVQQVIVLGVIVDSDT